MQQRAIISLRDLSTVQTRSWGFFFCFSDVTITQNQTVTESKTTFVTVKILKAF